MKPDIAIIYFTVCSGTGYGMIISLLSILFNYNLEVSLNIKFIILFLSFFLISSGLIASTIHLGHPERAWRALSQWKSSWLSREGVAAILTFFPLILFYILWILNQNLEFIKLTLIISSICSLITIFCTAKIYSSIKAIPAWNNPFVEIIYILNALLLGSIFTFTIFFCFEIKIYFLSNLIIILSLTSLFFKLLYWYSIKKTSNTNIFTATGLGDSKRTSFFEGPHTGRNFLTTEMINKINFSISILLRTAFCILTYITPAYYMFIQPNLIVSNYVASITFILIAFLALFGMFTERYLFFIESKHTVSLFYGNKTI